MKDDAIELSIVMPCLNEAETLASCIRKAQGFFARSGISGEIIIGDNGSTDGSVDLARSLGARVVCIEQKGYGHALMGAIHEARADFVIMGDADDSYDFGALDSYVEKLREGYDLVMGNRFKGGIAPDAMPALHRYFGNPLLTAPVACSSTARAATSSAAFAVFASRRCWRSISARREWSSRVRWW